jgi:hypothetical protein
MELVVAMGFLHFALPTEAVSASSILHGRAELVVNLELDAAGSHHGP